MSRLHKSLLLATLVVFAFAACHKVAKKDAATKEVKATKSETAKPAAPAPAPQKTPAKPATPPAPPKEQVQASEIKIEKLVTASEVVNRQPQGETETFNIPSGSDSIKVFTWNRVLGAKGETNLLHVYYHSGKKIDEVTLKINSPSYRTWSSKQIFSKHLGDWKVEATDTQGNVLASRTFTVAAGAPQALESKTEVKKTEPTAPAKSEPKAETAQPTRK